MTNEEDSTTEEALEPCPFCPYPTERYFAVREVGWQYDKEMERRLVTVCSQCGAQGPAFGVMSFNNAETAAQYWNRRTPASAAPIVDEMITVLEDIRGFYSTSNCWCDADGDSPHFEQCERAAEFYERLKLSRSHAANRPKIICLCGSTRFIEQFAITTWELEREGYIVLGCTLLPMWYCKVPSHFGEATGTKEQCDALHLRKIDLADEVLVLNIGGYIGESTRNEIAYATMIGKPVRYVESESAAATAAPKVSNDLLRDAGAIIIVNEGSAGARVEIRFAELQDAQRLHQALAQMRVAAPVDHNSIPLIGYERILTIEWDKYNARRHELIKAERSRVLSESEVLELFELQWLARIKHGLSSGPRVTQKQALPDHFLCINPEEQPIVINFLRGYGTDAERELARLHLNLCLRCQELANAAPVEQSDSSIPTCPDCQQGYICERCGKSIIDYYSGNEGAR